MPREVRYWHSRSFFRVYGRDPSAKGFPHRDPEGCYLTMGYRIRLDDGQPEGAEPSPHPSPLAAREPRRQTGRPRAVPARAPEPEAAPVTPAARVSFRHFEHSGGFDGFEGRMAVPPDPPNPKAR